MSTKIRATQYCLDKIFKQFEYSIPLYQRPYAWTIDQTSELFDDLFDFHRSGSEEDYFLGSIVLVKEESEHHAEVIDGQQRLTTLTILLSAIASTSEGEAQDTLKEYIHVRGNQFLGLEPKPRLKLRELDREFFSKYIQAFKFADLDALDSKNLSESQVNIQRNSQFLLQELKENFGSNGENRKEFTSFLLTKCFLVAVSTPSIESAFRVFSVMNSRGLDLKPTDIIKAEVIGKITSTQKQKEYNKIWEEMEVELGRDRFNDLFTYIRMIYAKEKAKKALLEEFRNHVIKDYTQPEDLIDEVLQPYATALGIVTSSNYRATSHSEEINMHIRWLNRIDNSDWIPAAILFLCKNKDNPEYVDWFFSKLELLAAFMHICAFNINERIRRYIDVIKAIQSNPLGEFKAIKLSGEDKVRMIEVLDGNIYQLTPNRKKYLMLRLDSFLSDRAALYNENILTIEHVLPQTVDENSEWAQWWPDPQLREQWMHRIANLVLLNKRRNSKAQNYNFAVKKDAYFSGSSNVTSYILTTKAMLLPEWKPENLEERQNELLEALKRKWQLDTY